MEITRNDKTYAVYPEEMICIFNHYVHSLEEQHYPTGGSNEIFKELRLRSAIDNALYPMNVLLDIMLGRCEVYTGLAILKAPMKTQTRLEVKMLKAISSLPEEDRTFIENIYLYRKPDLTSPYSAILPQQERTKIQCRKNNILSDLETNYLPATQISKTVSDYLFHDSTPITTAIKKQLLRNDLYYVDKIYVEPEYRGTGFGTFILKKLYQILKTHTRERNPVVMLILVAIEYVAGSFERDTMTEKLDNWYIRNGFISIKEYNSNVFVLRKSLMP